ncbi:MAG: relaxase domain-containing protein [Deferribacteraceae bacterium]|nr:relaxase domain-containing protein [Deferribacteraceae bacterium]
MAKPIRSATHAEDYYYEKDPIFAPKGKGANSRYFGKLEGQFNLSGQVQKKDFMLLIKGRDPRNGNLLVKAGINDDKESAHRPGIDLAFSAPKSVSIAALHLGDERIVDCHDTAVNKALAYVQDNLIQYRRTMNYKTDTFQSKNMIAACFTHGTSRANDPQLHTHAIVENITRCNDGKFRAISNELILRHQKLINSIYQNELAIELQKLGYSIDNYGNKFELRGISEEALKTFSKRSKEIQALYDKLKEQYPNMSKAELRDKAVLESRADKDTEITYSELKELWNKQISRDSIQPVMQGKGEIWERDLFAAAVEEIEKKDATFSRMKLLNEMFTLSKGEYSLSEMEAMIDKNISEGAIRNVGIHKYYNVQEEHFATLKTIITENRIIEIINSTEGAREAILEAKEFERMLSREYETAEHKKELTDGQRAFVSGALTSKDFVGFVQGDAGTGKTAAVERIKEILDATKSDVEMIGLGFTGIAADELNRAAKIDTSTIASFLTSKKTKEMNNKLFLVDEASMVDSNDFLNIMELALKGENNRVVFVGDAKQFQAIGAGKMFKELQESGLTKGHIRVIMMNEILRQKTPEMKELVKLVKEYKDEREIIGVKDAAPMMEAAFNLMEKANYIHEMRAESKDAYITRSMIQERAVNEFLSSEDSLMFTATREERNELNRLTRDKKFSDEILAAGKKITIRENNGESRLATSYKINDIITPKGQYRQYRVKEVKANENKLVLARGNKTLEMNLSREGVYRSYRESSREIVLGEAVMFTDNNKRIGVDDGLERGVKNGLKGIVEKLDNAGNMAVRLRDGRLINFNLKDYNHLEYAYAVTSIKTQGATCKTAIMVHTAEDNVKTESFYTAATRASHDLKIFTPDKARLKSAVLREQEKTSTISAEFYDNTSKIITAEKAKVQRKDQGLQI